MYSLLLKERDYPISVYLSFMTRVRGLTRAEAISLLTHSAVKLGLRKELKPPASNTIAKWGRTTDVPQWAIVTAMSITESLGKVPFTDKEWAFWSYSASELGALPDKYSGVWKDWLLKAYRYKAEYELRHEYRKRFQSFSYPDVTSKIVIFYRGNNLAAVNIPTILFALDSSNLLTEVIEKTMASNELFTNDDMQYALLIVPEIEILEEKISVSVRELVSNGFATHLHNGYIVIP
ncbi:hypothetical protein MNZ66_004476 [Salmonella enterica]|nr:hypothetical protein [Salmonella enterica]